MEMINNQLQNKIKEDFLNEWTIDRLKTMSIDEYTNLDKTSFCYWLEAVTTHLGSVWGGSAYKFGIFKRKDLDSDNYNDKRKSDGEYAWYGKYGDTRDEVFEKIRTTIFNIANFSQQNNLKEIDNIDLGDAIKWKIAFLYGDYNIINIFKHSALKTSAEYLGYQGKDKSYSKLNEFILSKKGDRDFYGFAKELWSVFDSKNTIKVEYEKWLKSKSENDNSKISSYLKAIDILISAFKIEVYNEEDIDSLEDLYDDLKLKQKDKNGKYYYEKSPSFGIDGLYSAAIGSYIEFIQERNQDKTIEKNDILKPLVMGEITDLNQIFFGPPGTGKTYHTINEAIKIADPVFYQEYKDDRDKLKERFKLLLLKNDNESVGQIGFTTFHQSFSYEDFIEGIKPVEPADSDTFLKYDIREGVFKRICRLANDSLNAVNVYSNSLMALSKDEYDKAHFYKMSLGNTQNEDDNEIFDYCVENNCITIGFGQGLNFTGKDEKELRSFGQDNGLESFPIQAMNLFCNFMKVGNYVVISYGNLYVRAIGRVTGEYEFKDESPFPNNSDYKHFRSVEWIFHDTKIGAKEIYNKNLSQQSIYKLEKKEIKQEFFVKEKKIDSNKLPKNPKNFVLIIDEINRGNVSSIFGELITLIEKDKRAGCSEELSVTLPYSKKEFKVPHNVYLIGTMNTADRSIEALDTALRRRFSFREMPPNQNLILTEGELKDTQGKIGDIDVVKILETINDRLEKLIDKDHKIGHSYFLGISNESDLKAVFKNKVIPLLEEYFFGDFGKISLVLGSSFISKSKNSGVTFAKNNEYDPSIATDLLERSIYKVTEPTNWDFKAIYE
jgi:5-methylcytosine-specific restriction protein B